MRKKIIIGSIIVLLLVLLVLFFIQKKQDVELPTEDEIVSIELTGEELIQIQETFHDKGVGFIHQIYELDEQRYLITTRTRDKAYGDEYPADQLVWVEKDKENLSVTPLATGDHPLRLVLNQTHPYFTQNGEFYFVFYEGIGTEGLLQKGKGYVYHIDREQGAEKLYETKGNYSNFAIDKQKRMVIVEKVEIENRNLYPSYLSPYVLKYEQYHEGKWTTIQEKNVEPDLIEEYEKYEEKVNKK